MKLSSRYREAVGVSAHSMRLRVHCLCQLIMLWSAFYMECGEAAVRLPRPCTRSGRTLRDRAVCRGSCFNSAGIAFACISQCRTRLTLMLFGGPDKLVHPQAVHASRRTTFTPVTSRLPITRRALPFFARDSASSRSVHVRRFHAEPRVGV